MAHFVCVTYMKRSSVSRQNISSGYAACSDAKCADKSGECHLRQFKTAARSGGALPQAGRSRRKETPARRNCANSMRATLPSCRRSLMRRRTNLMQRRVIVMQHRANLLQQRIVTQWDPTVAMRCTHKKVLKDFR